MADNNLGPKSNFIPEVVAGVKEAHNIVMNKYKTKGKKIISSVKSSFTKKQKNYGETNLLNGGDE